MSKGYIGVTDSLWFQFHKNDLGCDQVNFWRKNTNKFKVLNSGEKFFFLVKNPKGKKGERSIGGFGTFKEFKVLKISEAWNEFQEGNGFSNESDFINKFSNIYENFNEEQKIGCIVLEDIVFLENKVYLSNLGIDFKSSIVSGKTISEAESKKIIEQANIEAKNIILEVDERHENNDEFYDNDIEFNEGKKQLKKHYSIERNPKVIKRAKEIFLERNNRLYCEVCGFDFYKTYGSLGDNFIEGHHNKPLNKYTKSDKTKISDIKMVCANCHRVIHRNNIEFEKIKELFEVLKL